MAGAPLAPEIAAEEKVGKDIEEVDGGTRGVGGGGRQGGELLPAESFPDGSVNGIVDAYIEGCLPVKYPLLESTELQVTVG